MKTIYHYLCLNCWKDWKSTEKYVTCLKCHSEKLDIKKDLDWEK
jgi:Zn finger protein HypA/HybF involved in hydrogenase expression